RVQLLDQRENRRQIARVLRNERLVNGEPRQMRDSLDLVRPQRHAIAPVIAARHKRQTIAQLLACPKPRPLLEYSVSRFRNSTECSRASAGSSPTTFPSISAPPTRSFTRAARASSSTSPPSWPYARIAMALPRASLPSAPRPRPCWGAPRATSAPSGR